MTIKEIRKPTYTPKNSPSKKEKPSPGTSIKRLASVVVVPPGNIGDEKESSGKPHVENKRGNKNRSGSVKRKNKSLKKNDVQKCKDNENNLVAMFSRAAATGSVNRSSTVAVSTPTTKRPRSSEVTPDSDSAQPSKKIQVAQTVAKTNPPPEILNSDSAQPNNSYEIAFPKAKVISLPEIPNSESAQPSNKQDIVQPEAKANSPPIPTEEKTLHASKDLVPPTNTALIEEQPISYRDAVLQSLQFIICLPGRPNITHKEAQGIHRLLNESIEQALINGTAIPIVRNAHPKHDGVYVSCSDSTCAKWLNETMNGVIPWEGCQATLIVIPQTERPKLIRTVVCVPTIKDNSFILDRMAQLNSNLNVRDWIIKARKPVGSNRKSFKTSLFIRMDEESVERLKPMNFRLNWIGRTVQVNLQNANTKPRLDKPVLVDNSTVTEGSQSRASSIENSNQNDSMAKPVKQGLTRKGGSSTSGTTHSKQLDGSKRYK